MATTIKQAASLLETKTRFYTPTLRAEWETIGYPTPETILEGYVVRSYGVEIARYVPNSYATITTQKYSQTTSRHTNLVRKAWGLN